MFPQNGLDITGGESAGESHARGSNKTNLNRQCCLSHTSISQHHQFIKCHLTRHGGYSTFRPKYGQLRPCVPGRRLTRLSQVRLTHPLERSGASAVDYGQTNLYSKVRRQGIWDSGGLDLAEHKLYSESSPTQPTPNRKLAALAT
jgi:hypothetical protein